MNETLKVKRARRMYAREAEVKLRHLLDTYDSDDVVGEYEIMRKKTDEFLEWLWQESPIS